MKNHIENLFKKYRQCKYFQFNDEYIEFVQLIEGVVMNLPDIERELIEKRYMDRNTDYIIDRNVYEFKMDTPIVAATYIKIRTRAFNNIIMMLNIEGDAIDR